MSKSSQQKWSIAPDAKVSGMWVILEGDVVFADEFESDTDAACQLQKWLMARDDENVEYVDEVVQELSSLARDIGDDWGAKTYKARVQHLIHSDAIRNSICAMELRRWMQCNEENIEAYKEMVPKE